MKTPGIMVIVLAMLVGMTGFATSDTGIYATPETQGISTVTTVHAAGSMVSTTGYTLENSDTTPLSEIPPIEDTGYYVSTYSENTLSNGRGGIAYTKLMDIETADRNVNQYNIEAFKQVTFTGEGASSMVTTETIFVDGIAPWSNTNYWADCVFAPSLIGAYIPSFCNAAEAGSSVDMLDGSVTTSTSNRFIMAGGDPGVVLDHHIRVVDTLGKASAFLEVNGLEDRSTYSPSDEDMPAAFEKFSLREVTSVDGVIGVFDKFMHYESSSKR